MYLDLYLRILPVHMPFTELVIPDLDVLVPTVGEVYAKMFKNRRHPDIRVAAGFSEF